MKKVLTAMILAALALALCASGALAKTTYPDYSEEGWYRVNTTAPEGYDYSYIYSKPSSTQGRNLGKVEDDEVVYLYFVDKGTGRKSSLWGYCEYEDIEGYMRFENLEWDDEYNEENPQSIDSDEEPETDDVGGDLWSFNSPSNGAASNGGIGGELLDFSDGGVVVSINDWMGTDVSGAFDDDDGEYFDDGDGEYFDDGSADDDGGDYLGEMTVVNCKQWVSLREEPDSLSDRLLKVPKGAVVEAYAYDDTWFACEYKGEFGYILSYYLD